MFWARTVDRKKRWSSLVINSLEPHEQVAVCHRLGYTNTFNPSHPEMHYCLRMNRPDEYNVSYAAQHTEALRIPVNEYRVISQLLFKLSNTARVL